MTPANRFDVFRGEYRDAPGPKPVPPPPESGLGSTTAPQPEEGSPTVVEPRTSPPVRPNEANASRTSRRGADSALLAAETELRGASRTRRERSTIATPEPDPFSLNLGLLGEMAQAVAADVQVTPAFALATALGVAALPVGLGASVQVREGWQEPAILQVAVIASPSERKSPLLNALMDSLYGAQRKLRDKRDAEIAEAEAAERPNKPGSLVAPPRFRAFVGKATAEALEHLAAEQGNNLAARQGNNRARIAVVTDEGAGALGDLGRYQASTNYDPLVSGYDAMHYSSVRLSRDSVDVDELRVPVLLMVQPSVWEGLRDDPAAVDRGVLARFSPVRPESLVGTRFGRGTPIPDRTRERWAERLSALLKAAYEPAPHIMKLSPDALDVFSAASDANEVELGTVREDETWSGWEGKLTGRMVRIAGVLHALNTGSVVGEISAEEMRTAVALGRWLEWHAERELSAVLSPDARRLLAWAEKRAEPFSPRWLVFCEVFWRLTLRWAATDPELAIRAARISELAKYGQRRVRSRRERRGQALLAPQGSSGPGHDPSAGC